MVLTRSSSSNSSVYKKKLAFSILKTSQLAMERVELTNLPKAEQKHLVESNYLALLSAQQHNQVKRKSWRIRLVQWLINTRCTENSIWVSSSVLGLITLGMQSGPLFMLNWVHITEPRPINRTDDKGDPMEVQFSYNAGYFEIESRNMRRKRCLQCKDLGEFSFATNAILVRLTVPTVLHLCGTSLTAIAFLLSVYGHWQKDRKTLCSAIFYVLGGLTLLVGILQFICIVDDEMYPRMKPTAGGEPSAFSFRYGYSFMAAALSFLPIQICIYLQTSAYFNRYKSPNQKAKVVPGLSELLQQVATIRSRSHQLGRLASVTAVAGSSGGVSSGVGVNFAARRRESRTSKDFGVLEYNRK
uniref:Uncharacterized protein n=1 Tax=Ditylenchus dipsaci TaxID=166011 RepID=A0A915DAU5_9BILA